MIVTVLGLSAGVCGIASVVPQVVRVIRTKSTRDLSKWMWVIVTIGNGLWTAYGIAKLDAPIIVSNGVQFVLVGIVLRYKLRYG
jgi:MtN3 and saliva related transmembrane protein